MELRQLDKRELTRLYRDELVHDFPKTELKPLNNMLQMMEEDCYEPWLAEENGEALGYALVWLGPDRAGALLDYLGTLRGKRNRGLGGQIIALLAERYEHIFGEAEAPSSQDPAENELRRRRLGFYTRNGFRILDYDCALFGVHYKCLYLGREADDRGIEAMHRAVYDAHLPPRLLKPYVQLPLRPGEVINIAPEWLDSNTELEDFPGSELS